MGALIIAFAMGVTFTALGLSWLAGRLADMALNEFWRVYCG